MFSPTEMSHKASTLFSAYASLMGFIMLLRSMTNDVIPQQLRSYLVDIFHRFFTPLSSELTLIIDEVAGRTDNQVFEAAEVYLRTKISPKTERLKVSKNPKQKNFYVSIDKGEEITDFFDNFQLKWKYFREESENSHPREKLFFELTFQKNFKDRVMNSYLPYVLAQADKIKQQEKVVKLYDQDCPYDEDDGGGGRWGSINLEHPATFDKLAMDPELKQMIINDLDRFVRRKDYYKKVGKIWKRGYLLYGPPGTGKSSLVAAMANYLKFDIYDLDLASVYSNSALKSILLSTKNRSILVIEDIDCSSKVKDREDWSDDDGYNSKLTLSGILNFIDGLWSSCGDERIIVFTTNHKDRLDPALLRPGRMDVHIHMSYCTVHGFRVLASNYLGISPDQRHPLYDQIESLIESTEVTPAEVAEELMKDDNADIALQGLVNFLKRKKSEVSKVGKAINETEMKEPEMLETDNEEKKFIETKKRRDEEKVFADIKRKRGRRGRRR